MSSANREAMERAAAAVESFVIAGAIQLLEEIADLNNAGGDGAPPAPMDTGQLRGSLRVTVGTPSAERGEARPARGGDYRLTTGREVRRAVQLGGFRVGDVIWGRWIAPYANIIDGGRRPDKNGRMIGFAKAPDGWVGPDIEAAMARMERWRWAGGAA